VIERDFAMRCEGDNINGYQIVELIGEGSTAYVWRAYDPKLDRDVALKEARTSHLDSTEKRAAYNKRFLQEGRIAANLNNSGILTVYSVFLFDSRPFLVTELVDGVTLRDLVNSNNERPSASQAWLLMEQLLEAAAYAHKQGVIHKDLKLSNVFLTREGDVKLGDFGIAHHMTNATMTHGEELAGTPAYMSPEQIRGERLDARTDVFSLGVLGYELLLGKNPFINSDHTHFITIMHRILTDPPPELDSDDAEILRMYQVLTAAMAKDKDARPADAAELLALWQEVKPDRATDTDDLSDLSKCINVGQGQERASRSLEIRRKTEKDSRSAKAEIGKSRWDLRLGLIVALSLLLLAGVTSLGHRLILGRQSQVDVYQQQVIDELKEKVDELKSEKSGYQEELRTTQEELQQLKELLEGTN
jgi:serine/threonine protein kinase